MLNELKNVLDKDFDYNNLVNSTLDIKKNSVLLINNDSETRLDELVLDAINKNVKNIITSKNCTLANSKIVKVENYEKTFNELLIKLCKNFDKKNYFGITGTNGKTTTGYYLNQLIKNKSIFIGTTEEDLFKNITNEEHLTTPKLFNILKLLSKEENKDINDVVIEVSSHALDQERLKGIYFKVSGFTNLSQDHFDYHKNIDNYFASKLKMFTEDSSEKFVYVDSEWGNKLKHESKLPSFSIGYKSNNNLYIEKINVDKESFDLEFYLDGKKYEISVPLSGPLAHMNYLLALSMAYFSEQYKLNGLLTKFLKFLVSKRRFFYVEKILKDFIETCSKKRGEVKAELTSAKELSESEINNIKDELSKNFSSKIKLNYKFDPNLIGGLIVQVGSTMVDTSIKNKLKQIENRMVEA